MSGRRFDVPIRRRHVRCGGPIWALLLCLLASSGSARAADVRGTSSTIFIGREDPRGGEEVSSFPLYELLAVEVDELIPAFDASRLVIQGWGRLQPGDDPLQDDSADLRLLYLDAKAGPVAFRLGRQHVLRGVGRMNLIDGGGARVAVIGGLSAEAYGGVIVPREFDYDSGAWLTGGRVAYRLGLPAELGLSYAHRWRDGELYREEAGVDGYALVGPVHIGINAAMAPNPAQLSEARLTVSYTPLEAVRITVDAERVSPDLLLPRDSIFSVFAEADHDAIGGDVVYAPSRYYEFMLAGHALLLDGDLLGSRTTLRATTFREANHRSQVGGELRFVDESDNGYLRGRVFAALQILDPLRVSGDLYGYAFDERIEASINSYVGQASVIYDITPSIRVAATGLSGWTPFANRFFEGTLQFSYGYHVDWGREVAP